MKIPDAHVHAYKIENLKVITKDFVLLSVAEDLASSLQNIKLSILYEEIIPAVGIHPWNVSRYDYKVIDEIEKLIENSGVKVLGEVGLDKIKSNVSLNIQVKFFEKFVELAKEYDLSLNIHHLGAEKDIISILERYKIDGEKVYFHWANPEMNLRLVLDYGGFVGINVSLLYNPKYERVVREAPIEQILIESDGVWEYKGKILHPSLLPELVEKISRMLGESKEKIILQVRRNLSKYLS